MARHPKLAERRVDFACQCNDGTVFVAEVQLEKHNHWQSRSVFYPAGAYVNQLKKGDDWSSLCAVVAINLLGFETGMIQEPGEYSILLQLMDSRRSVILPLIQILNVELPRICLEALPDGLLKGWLTLLIKSSELKEIPAYFDATLRKAMKLLEWSDWDEEMKRKYHNSKFNRDDYSIVIEETAAKARYEGEIKGKIEGKIEGQVIGFAEGVKMIALRMLNEKKSFDEISRFTGLSEAEILALVRT